MSDEEKLGQKWENDELDLIVADYFAMLGAELEGRSYVKARHSAALMDRIGRTHRSVEFKHQNISAVLDELGLPWIAGYKPKRNYQNTIFDAIDRYLSRNPAILDLVPNRFAVPSSLAGIFVNAPVADPLAGLAPERLRRLARKFDPVERDNRNRLLGSAGEEFVVALEQRLLTEGERPDLARKVRWVSAEDGDGAGYDVRSFDLTGRERLLEVKTTNGSARTPFFITRNEADLAAERPTDWLIYRVHLFVTRPRIFVITPPLQEVLNLTPETWRASF